MSPIVTGADGRKARKERRLASMGQERAGGPGGPYTCWYIQTAKPQPPTTPTAATGHIRIASTAKTRSSKRRLCCMVGGDWMVRGLAKTAPRDVTAIEFIGRPRAVQWGCNVLAFDQCPAARPRDTRVPEPANNHSARQLVRRFDPRAAGCEDERGNLGAIQQQINGTAAVFPAIACPHAGPMNLKATARLDLRGFDHKAPAGLLHDMNIKDTRRATGGTGRADRDRRSADRW